jgi:hypothetical protein
MKTLIIGLALAFIALVNTASAHRLTGHDYRSTAHWCTWSAAKVCTAWRARGGTFICPPGNMSMSCRLQRGV